LDNLTSYKALFLYVLRLIEDSAETEDDEKLAELLSKDEICHASQPIRDCRSDDIHYQYITLRYGEKKDESVFALDLSEKVRSALDLFALYLAIRQTQFELETFHPDLLNNVVVAVNASTLLWPKGQHFVEQLMIHHKKPLSMIVPSLYITQEQAHLPLIREGVSKLQEKVHEIYFDVHLPVMNLDYLAPYRPRVIKVSNSLEDQSEKRALLPIIRYLKRTKTTLIAGRVTSQITLQQYKMLGAKYYFGYVTDIPTPVKFKGFDDPKAAMRKAQRDKLKQEKAPVEDAAEDQLAIEEAERLAQQEKLDASIDNLYASAKPKFEDDELSRVIQLAEQEERKS
jgi:EAL domain-containing protein (putative c-di-GMP-specific phosphodiesterase class I)